MALALVSQSLIPDVPAFAATMDLDFPEPHQKYFPPSGFLYVNMYSRMRMKNLGESSTTQQGDFALSWSINGTGKEHHINRPQIVAEGILTQGPAFLKCRGQGHGVALVLHPLIAYHFFQERLDNFTNGHADLSHLTGTEIDTFVRQLEDGCILSWDKEPLLGFLRKRIGNNHRWKRDPIFYAVNRIIQNKGIISVKKLAEEVCMSERNLERQFQQKVGVSPKTYASIWRFQFALLLIKAKKYRTLEDLAHQAGYYDLPHLIKDFRAKTGRAFEQFLQETPELLRFHQQTTQAG